MRFYILPFCLCLGGARDDAVALKEIGVTLPQAIGNIRYATRTSVEKKALDYTVIYGNKETCRICLRVCGHDKKKIPDGKDNALVEEQLKRSIQGLKRLYEGKAYTNLQRMKDDLPLPKEVKATFATAGFTFEDPVRVYKRYFLVVGRNNCFLNVEVTQYVVDGKANDEEVNAFLTALLKEMSAKAK